MRKVLFILLSLSITVFAGNFQKKNDNTVKTKNYYHAEEEYKPRVDNRIPVDVQNDPFLIDCQHHRIDVPEQRIFKVILCLVTQAHDLTDKHGGEYADD